MRENGRVTQSDRALHEAMTRVGDRWTLQVVAALLDGPRRFADLQAALPGVASNILSARLKHLEREGLARAIPYSKRPPRMEYELTATGMELAGALRLLASWGASVAPHAETPRHAACGTPVEARWWCPTCARMVDEDDDGDVRWV
jgi:DNA-binding HxlR family transcriptional regulator